MNEGSIQEVESEWMAAMRRGDFERAWRATDRIELGRRVREAAGTFVRESHHLIWNGARFDGKRVLVRCNHGLGDSIQFIRYVPLVRAVAADVTVLVQPHLLELFAGAGQFGNVRNGWTDQPPPAHDVEIEVMELPYAFRSTVETLPRDVPYIPFKNIEPHSRRLPPLDAGSLLNVGLLWATSDWDPTRSIRLPELEPVMRVAGVRFHSLQQGAATPAELSPVPVLPLSEHTRAIGAAAAAMLALDLIITVDGMVAHLAGALGRPVWLLLKHDADWRWMTHRIDSPWYPTMRIFRQKEPGDWAEVVDAVARTLDGFRPGVSSTTTRPRRGH